MADTKLEGILGTLPRDVAHDLAVTCKVHRLRDEIMRDAVVKELKASGYGTYWNRHNYFNSLFMRGGIRVSSRIAQAVRYRTPSQQHSNLIISGDAVFLRLNSVYGLILPPAETNGDPDVVYL